MMWRSMVPKIYLVRHGETAWSLSGQHTSRTDIPLTERGEQQAQRLGEILRRTEFAQIWSSPLQRARRTCEAAGLGSNMRIDPALTEWSYGEYEGVTSAEIRARRPGWNVFRDGCPGGESPEQVSARADQVVGRLRAMDGKIAVFSHGHFLRALAARWIALAVGEGQRLLLQTASLSILSCEHNNPEEPVIALWNAGLDYLDPKA
jgi:broad specificity phosphatase PhoE